MAFLKVPTILRGSSIQNQIVSVIGALCVWLQYMLIALNDTVRKRDQYQLSRAVANDT